MKNKKYFLSEPIIGKKEILYVNKSLKNNWLSSIGPDVKKFQKKLGKKLGTKNISLVNSGTSAIHLALISLNVKPNDIILTQSFTFVGSVNPIRYCNCKPVFIDSEKETLNIDPEKLEKAIKFYLKRNLKPKAIIVVHIYGIPCKIKKIISISKKYNIPVIEDAAEAYGSKVENKFCGTFGDIGILSFNANKILTCGGGGAIISKNINIIKQSDYLSSQAKENTLHYLHKKIGYNYRFNNLFASIGLGQIDSFEKKYKTYKKNFLKYSLITKKFHNINLFENKIKNTKWNYWQIVIFFEKKILLKKNITNIIKLFNDHNIQVRNVWKPIHTQPIYSKEKVYSTKNSEYFFKSSLCFPNSLYLDKNYFNKIENIFQNLDNL